MFNELLNELFANGAPSPNVIAWWLTPSDKLVDAHGEVDHYKVVVAQPQTFGISPRDPLLKNPEVNENKLVKLAVKNGAIRLVSAKTAYFIDSRTIDKATLDRVWIALPDLPKRELIWDTQVPFRGYTAWRGKLSELETLIESLSESHSRKTCMDCKKPPTKEVLWAEGMGHAWFCDACFNIWRAKHKDDINSIKAIKDGEAVKKFSDNHNPNEVRVTERDLFNTLRVLPDLKDSKLF